MKSRIHYAEEEECSTRNGTQNCFYIKHYDNRHIFCRFLIFKSRLMIISSLKEREYLDSILDNKRLNVFETNSDLNIYFEEIWQKQEAPMALFAFDSVSRKILRSRVKSRFGDGQSYDSIPAHFMAQRFPSCACDTAIQYIASKKLDKNARLSINYPISYKNHYRWALCICSLGYFIPNQSIVIFQSITRGERIDLNHLSIMSAELMRKKEGVYCEYDEDMCSGGVNISNDNFMSDVGKELGKTMFRTRREIVMKEVWRHALDDSNTIKKICKAVDKLAEKLSVSRSERTISRMLTTDIKKYSIQYLNTESTKYPFLRYLENQKILIKPKKNGKPQVRARVA